MQINKFKIITAGAVVALISSCSHKKSDIAYIPELEMYFRIEKSFLRNTLNEYPRTRLYISKSDTLWSDYIDFRNVQVGNPSIYYVPEDGFYVEDCDGFHQMEICKQQFNIHYVNLKYKYSPECELNFNEFSDLREAQRSVYMDKPHYSIYFGDNATGIYIFNPSGVWIYSSYRCVDK